VSEITTGTRLFAVLGDPVAHSLSPRMQNAALRAAGLDAVYTALRCSPDDLPGLLRGLARAGGGGNVTVPHKGLAASLVEEPSVAVLRTGACNTFWLEDGRVHGDNTDVAGFRAALEQVLPDPAGAQVLLLGAGGAAHAVVAALLEAEADRILVRNRSHVRARELVAAFGGESATLRLAEQDPASAGAGFDLVVNATSLGLRPADELPIDLERLGRVGAALDLVYASGETAWVRAARKLGIPAADGREMLVGQGAAAFERWWRQPAPVEVMRQAVRPN
jgi:shikimate dehydrogenase